MLKLALIVNNYPIISLNAILGLLDIKLHIILPRSIDITKPNKRLTFVITSITVFLLLVKMSCHLDIDNYSYYTNIIFNKLSGKAILVVAPDNLSVYLADTWYIGTITSDYHGLFLIHPSCLVFLLLSPKIFVFNSSILSVALKYPDINDYKEPCLLDITLLLSGINTILTKQTNGSISIVGRPNLKMPKIWDKLYWTDLPDIFLLPDLLTKINKSNLGLSSINGIRLSLTILSGPSVTVNVTDTLGIVVDLNIPDAIV